MCVTGPGLELLPGVASLDLSDAPITDEGMARLRGLTRLRKLCLADTHITGAGLERLSGLTVLDLSGTPVTDAGLERLKELTQLRELHLGSLRVTDAGVEALHRQLPGVTVFR